MSHILEGVDLIQLMPTTNHLYLFKISCCSMVRGRPPVVLGMCVDVRTYVYLFKMCICKPTWQEWDVIYETINLLLRCYDVGKLGKTTANFVLLLSCERPWECFNRSSNVVWPPPEPAPARGFRAVWHTLAEWSVTRAAWKWAKRICGPLPVAL